MAKKREVQRYGDKFAARPENSTANWKTIELDDVTPLELEVIVNKEARLERIRTMGFDPEQPPVPFARVIPAGHPDNTATQE